MVLTILSLFAVLALPRFITSIGRAKLSSAMNTVRQALYFARARSAATGVRHQLTLDRENRLVTVEAFQPEMSMSGNGLSGAGGPTGQPGQNGVPPALLEQFPEGIEVAEWSVTPLEAMIDNPTRTQSGSTGIETMFFYPEGRGDSAYLVLEDGGERRAVEIDGFRGEIRELTREEMQTR